MHHVVQPSAAARGELALGSPRSAARPRRPGAVAVEMAFILPVLLLFVFGSIEFGRALMACNLLTTAARVGARTGALYNGTNSDVQQAVQNELTANKLSGGNATIHVYVNDVETDVTSAQTGNRIRVTVSVGFDQLSWLPTPDWLGGTQLVGRAEMRRE